MIAGADDDMRAVCDPAVQIWHNTDDVVQTQCGCVGPLCGRGPVVLSYPNNPTGATLDRRDLEAIADVVREHDLYVVHRALYGSFERFIGILIEHYAGAFPLWLAPVQAVVVPIADRHLEYAESVANALRATGFRVEVDTRREKMQAKIRDAQAQQLPYMLIVGDRDQQAGTVSIRDRRQGDLGPKPLAEFLQMLEEHRASRS